MLKITHFQLLSCCSNFHTAVCWFSCCLFVLIWSTFTNWKNITFLFAIHFQLFKGLINNVSVHLHFKPFSCEGKETWNSPAMSNSEVAGQEAPTSPHLYSATLPLLLAQTSNYSATCQLKTNRSRICHLTGWWRYFCLVIFQISAGFHLFNSLAVAFVPGWHFLRKELSHCVHAHFIWAHCRCFPC